MTDREFFDRVERELREIVATPPHATNEPTLGKNGFVRHHVSAPQLCRRCRLERLADEAADRAMQAAA